MRWNTTLNDELVEQLLTQSIPTFKGGSGEVRPCE
jgi:hypothetical protein